jgi:topoisomerase-4 subunit B
MDLLYSEVGDKTVYPIAYQKGKQIEFSFTHTDSNGETYFSFVNGQFTSDGGTHQSAFREGILKGVNEFYQKQYSGIDVREGIAGAISIKLKTPVFESQTKNKLGNTEIRSWIVQEVKSGVVDFLHKNLQASKSLEDKIVRNEKLRKELNAVRKEAKEAAKKIALKIPNLKDCKYHLEDGKKGEESTIFITEGASASGSMVSARDVYTQAIFSLRGKPQNMFGKTKAAIYKNEELFNLMMALNIENDVDDVRYAKIVIATDADYDGFHIRNLLLTFFLNYFEELVVAGRVYILETPLFRVRNKKVTRYCYNMKERNEAMDEISSPEVTRFKGLGEISPKEFGQFIGDDIRLVRVNLKTLKEISDVLEFYMGKNTPDRREFIMENLI